MRVFQTDDAQFVRLTWITSCELRKNDFHWLASMARLLLTVEWQICIQAAINLLFWKFTLQEVTVVKEI